MQIPTPHIGVTNKNEIAKTVLMPGDPLRAKHIAENYLENPVLFNQIRNVFGYTGNYKGKPISVMASGMGMASIGIYSYELFAFYGVENIIRIGSCGAYTKDIALFDVLLCEDVYSESSYALAQSGNTRNILKASTQLNKIIKQTAQEKSMPLQVGCVHSSDVFYRKNAADYEQIRDQYHCVAVEMEAFALFANADLLNKNAATILTVSDHLVLHQAISAQDRQINTKAMIELALEAGIRM